MNDWEKRILNIIEEHPGLTAKEIGKYTGDDPKEVRTALYGPLQKYCYRRAYYWYPQEQAPVEDGKAGTPDARLSSLCHYYLDCMAIQESDGVKGPLHADTDLPYAELKELEIDSTDANVARLIRKVSAGRHLTAYVGYPVLVEKVLNRQRKEWEWQIAPVFLFPVEIHGGAVYRSTVPSINREVVRQYSSHGSESLDQNLIRLETELGLNNRDFVVDIEEMTCLLREIRDWNWREPLDSQVLHTEPPLASLTEEGIYNKAVFIVSELAPYTQGLAQELEALSKLPAEAYKGTALYDWIYEQTQDGETDNADVTPLLEVLPMNSEQEAAIRCALEHKLTVVTGPPGTGKSQVVTNLLINAAWRGKKVLFTSRNNKAVDVVEERVNALGASPIMVRIGPNQYARHLAEQVSRLLTYNADEKDVEEYEFYTKRYDEELARYEDLRRQKQAVMDLRNEADHLERQVCDLRPAWGPLFSTLSTAAVSQCAATLETYQCAYDQWYKGQHTFPSKLFWFLWGKGKTGALQAALDQVRACFTAYGQPGVPLQGDVPNEQEHEQLCTAVKKLAGHMEKIAAYNEARKALTEAPPLEQLDRSLVRMKANLAEIGKKRWQAWLLARPIQITAQQRQDMHAYIAAVQLAKNVDCSDFPDFQRKYRQLQRKMTDFLPCWAVTALSARHRIPFEPGLLDLVVIDEASQCDIASMLPMLYRAKRAVIIGDPKQLPHISNVSNRQDLYLEQKYAVSLNWAFSAVSLYDLASSLSQTGRILTLRDHHRSYADIIGYSNAEFYAGKLRVATQSQLLHCPEGLAPGIHWLACAGKTERPPQGSVYNTVEATAVVEALRQYVIDTGFTGSVGVVTPFRAQAKLINRLIGQDPFLYSSLDKNHLLIDTVHRFQGDERDVIFFSPVISNGTKEGTLRFLESSGNLFNVAVTRARAALIVVGDEAYCAEHGASYLQHFVAYVRQLNQNRSGENIPAPIYPAGRDYPPVSNEDQVSLWERAFYTALYDAGICTIPQYPVEKYKLDLALIDGTRHLDIEVDGEMYHRDWNGELMYRDQLRNQRLFELGWDVKRFWVCQIRDDSDGCVKEIKKWLGK